MTPIDEPTYPFPPRYWWLKRIVAGSMLLIAAFAGAMWWWSYEAHRRMQAEVDAIHARGEPVLIEDYARAPISDAKNAASLLKRATTAIALPAPEDGLVDNLVLTGPELSPADRALLASAHQKLAVTRQLARDARFAKDVDWALSLRTPVMMILLPNLNTQRTLSNSLRACAWHEHLSGDDAEALETCRDILRQAEALGQPPNWLVSHLISIGINAQANNLIRALSYDLQVQADARATTQPTGPASREQVKQLIAELLDDRALRDGWTHAMQGERTSQYDAVTTKAAIAGVVVPPPGPLSIIRPAFVLDGIRMMRAMAIAAEASHEPTFHKAKIKTELAFAAKPSTPLSMISRLMSMQLNPSTTLAMRTHYRVLTDRRVAALRLAIRLYQLDHSGAYPQRLAELCPDYLPAVPNDPFALDGGPMKYVASPEPMLYSAGEDGRDDGGSAAMKPPQAVRSGAVRQPRPVAPADPPPGHPDDTWQWERADLLYAVQKPTWQPPPPTTEDSQP